MINRIITEEIKKVILEKLEVENYNIEEIYQEVVDNFKNGCYRFTTFVKGPNFNKQIEIRMYDSPVYGGGSFVFFINLEFPFSNPDFNGKIKEMIYHEVTHFINNNLPKRTSKYFPMVGRYDNYIDIIQDILYRLWNRDERIAYLCRSISGIEESKRYIERLSKEIRDIETLAPYLEIDPQTEKQLWELLIPTLVTIRGIKSPLKRKKYFIKKSKHLLEWFKNKLLKNAYRLNQNG
jgi:hypothetical protein